MVVKFTATECSENGMSSMYVLGDEGDVKKDHIRWGSGLFCHLDIGTIFLKLNIHWLCTVVLNTERPPPQGELCLQTDSQTEFQTEFPRIKYCLSSIKLNLLSTIPFLPGSWNESWRDYFLGKLVEKPWCRQFPFWLQPDFHLLSITSSSGSGVSKESSA